LTKRSFSAILSGSFCHGDKKDVDHNQEQIKMPSRVVLMPTKFNPLENTYVSGWSDQLPADFYIPRPKWRDNPRIQTRATIQARRSNRENERDNWRIGHRCGYDPDQRRAWRRQTKSV
jgi:hypothetical protein